MKPTETPTLSPTLRPTENPTKNPTENPSKNPTKNPTANPTKNPTKNPTANPTLSPSVSPTLACADSKAIYAGYFYGNRLSESDTGYSGLTDLRPSLGPTLAPGDGSNMVIFDKPSRAYYIFDYVSPWTYVGTFTGVGSALSWTAIDQGFGEDFFVATDNDGMFVRSSSARFQTSTDFGVSWTDRALPFGISKALIIIWAPVNGFWLASFGNTNVKCATSPDGITWSNGCIRSPSNTAFFVGTNRHLYEVVETNTGRLLGTSIPAKGGYSDDGGVTWTATTDPSGNAYDGSIFVEGFNGGASDLACFVGNGGGTTGIFTSTNNGISYITGPTLTAASTMYDVATGNLIVTGHYSQSIQYTTDAVTWSSGYTNAADERYNSFAISDCS